MARAGGSMLTAASNAKTYVQNECTWRKSLSKFCCRGRGTGICSVQWTKVCARQDLCLAGLVALATCKKP